MSTLIGAGGRFRLRREDKRFSFCEERPRFLCTRPTLRLSLALLAGGVGCSDPMDTFAYENRRPFQPPPDLYLPWWNEVEACSDRSRDFEGVEWFLADQIGIGTGPTATTVKGQWLSNRQITIRSGFEQRMRVVKHEMLHDLLDGDPDHTYDGWGTCDVRAGMPGRPGIEPGAYSVDVRFTLGLEPWHFQGLLRILSVEEGSLVAEWDVASLGSNTAHYEAGPVVGEWDYDAYRVEAKVVGAGGWVIDHRISTDDDGVGCRGALIGHRILVCRVDGPL